MRLLIAISISLMLLLTSCQKEDSPAIDFGFEYYPTEVGNYRTYLVDCLVFNDFTLKTDTYQFWLKDITESQLKDLSGRTAYRMERHISWDQQNWAIQKVWTTVPDNQFVEEQVDNIRLVKLAFPVTGGLTWNANARNVLEDQDFSYERTKKDTMILGKTYTNTQRVEQYYVTDPLQIKTIISYEHYSPNIGLVNKYETYVKKFTTGVPGAPEVDSGFAMSMKLQDFDVAP